ncbi:MAG: hypothetical protein II625_04730 [Bacilli bacterium]|nr:hypothetical protein [Bacilli bacterium]
MAKQELDTKKIREKSDLLLKEISNFESITNKMFDRITKMPTETKEWEGVAATNFAAIAKTEKEQEFNLIISRMRQYVQELLQAASDFEATERNTRADDKNITEQR